LASWEYAVQKANEDKKREDWRADYQRRWLSPEIGDLGPKGGQQTVLDGNYSIVADALAVADQMEKLAVTMLPSRASAYHLCDHAARILRDLTARPSRECNAG
jgi:hypothetical protein